MALLCRSEPLAVVLQTGRESGRVDRDATTLQRVHIEMPWSVDSDGTA